MIPSLELEQRSHALFREAIDLSETDREPFVDRLNEEDPEVARRVTALLWAATSSEEEGFLDPSRLREFACEMLMRDGAPLAVAEPAIPERIGRYRIVEELGRGGMAVVYLAERADGIYQQRVALKILRYGLHGDEAILRFARERQILATLEHPLIARLLDGGVAEDGRPYLVMEYVRGCPIDTYAKTHDLSVPQRLNLVATICDAVAHAHRHLVVHRDLKPSNIVVDRDGRVCLLDFGIAKLLEPEALSIVPNETRSEVRLLTPRYASPEQVLGQAVGTTSDVYQLGVLLYELLTDTSPYPLDGMSAGQLERAICERDPVRPSAAAVPPTRGKALRGDLDAVVLKALTKDPVQRYESASTLGEDLRRHLAGLPVQAQRPTWGYLAAKAVKRHRLAFTAGGLFLTLLLAGLFGTLWQARRAAAERDRARQEAYRANQIKDFVLSMFSESDPRWRDGKKEQLTVVDLLDQGLARIPDSLDGQPAVQADMLDVIGRMLNQLSAGEETQKAKEALERALALRQQEGGGSPQDLAQTQYLLAESFMKIGQWDRALELARVADDLFRRFPPDDAAKFGANMVRVGTLLRYLGRDDEASEYLEEAVELCRREVGAEDIRTLQAITSLAMLRAEQGRAEEVLGRMEEAVDAGRRVADEEEFTDLLDALGYLYYRLDRLESAEECFREVIDIRSRIFHPEAAVLAPTLSRLGLVLFKQGDYEAAAPVLQRTLTLTRIGWGNEHPGLLTTLNTLARVRVRQGRLGEAEVLIEESSSLARRVLPPGHTKIADASSALAELRLAQGRLDDAEHSILEALSIYEDRGDRSKILTGRELLDRIRQANQPADG